MLRFIDDLAERWNRASRDRLGGHVYISGTGRAGTTFLVQLLTDLGLDTGFSGTRDLLAPPVAARERDDGGEGPKEPPPTYFDTARAGLERDVFAPNNPQVVKSPYLCEQLDAAVAAGIPIAHIIIPVRDLHSAAESRRHVQAETTGAEDGGGVAGGLWGTAQADQQEAALAIRFTLLVEGAIRHGIPFTFLSFPRFAQDPRYAYDRLRFLFPALRFALFRQSFDRVRRPDLIHDFRTKPAARTA